MKHTIGLAWLVLTAAACSSQSAEAPPPAALCAADALKAARQPALPLEEQDRLRAKVTLFIAKLTPADRQRANRVVDQLADGGGGSLIDPSACEALLTAAEKKTLAAETSEITSDGQAAAR